MYPHRVERGVEYLESLGFWVRIAPHAMNSVGYVSDTDENRVADIHAMFHDPEVKAVIATIGGDHSCHLLPLLDFGLIRANPKILMGYSDVTVLNVAIWEKTGLVTFNGPAVMVELAEYPKVFDYTERYMLEALCSSEPVGEIRSSGWWTEEFLDWGEKEDLARARWAGFGRLGVAEGRERRGRSRRWLPGVDAALARHAVLAGAGRRHPVPGDLRGET